MSKSWRAGPQSSKGEAASGAKPLSVCVPGRSRASGGWASVCDEQLLHAWARLGGGNTARSEQLMWKPSHLSPWRRPSPPAGCLAYGRPLGSVANSPYCSSLVGKQLVFGGKILWLDSRALLQDGGSRTSPRYPKDLAQQ